MKEKNVVLEKKKGAVRHEVKASGNFLQIPANHCDASAFYTTPFTQSGKTPQNTSLLSAV